MQYAKPVTLNVEECDRLFFLPYLFGNDFLYAEASVYALAQKNDAGISKALLALHPPAGRWRLHDAGWRPFPHGERCKLV
ncbi:hypothetical protein MY014_52900 [Escherichia coli]|nr:hypothetical protein MY014_52900 [Escherichia coli]